MTTTISDSNFLRNGLTRRREAERALFLEDA